MTAGSSPPLQTPIRYSWSDLGGTRSFQWCGPLCCLSPGHWAFPAHSSHTGLQSSHSYTGTCWAPCTPLHCGRLVHIWLRPRRERERRKKNFEVKSNSTKILKCFEAAGLLCMWRGIPHGCLSRWYYPESSRYKSTKMHSPIRQRGPSHPGLQQHLPVGVQCPFLQCLEQAVISSSGGSTWRWHSLGAWGLQQLLKGKVNMLGDTGITWHANIVHRVCLNMNLILSLNVYKWSTPWWCNVTPYVQQNSYYTTKAMECNLKTNRQNFKCW